MTNTFTLPKEKTSKFPPIRLPTGATSKNPGLLKDILGHQVWPPWSMYGPLGPSMDPLGPCPFVLLEGSARAQGMSQGWVDFEHPMATCGDMSSNNLCLNIYMLVMPWED